MKDTNHALWTLLNVRYKPHPWHGISPGDGAPNLIHCFIEVVPSDTVKYEIDKVSGYLRVDRPQKYSNVCPALYGFIPQSFCGTEVASLCESATGLSLAGDQDPIDVCVLTDRRIEHGNLIVDCIPIGGFRLLDGDEVDDKIVAVLQHDATYGSMTNIDDVPDAVLDRLRHYFLTYKQPPGSVRKHCEIAETYGCVQAQAVVAASLVDYKQRFGDLDAILSEALTLMQPV